MLGLLSAQTINLSKIAIHFKNNNKIASNYRRIQSFLKDMKIDFDAITEFNVRQPLSQKSKFNFILDRTNWQFVKNNINILVFSAVYEVIAIPLYYKLDHRGNSDSQTRIDLVKKFVNKFGKECIGSILGDREFGLLG
ncbi:hypothetical protein CYR73_01680 [Francisella tularensis subsp. holarctica]|nr:hypothetical protein F92_03565 [Francisella tularensis subsp. holarctica F92]AKH91534.1 transposase [Francisella tularensis subsp. tularensis WY-00W4114]AKO69001.1 transposase [Francisella tularensis subsp. holarctica]AUP75108.1 hypothetical protein CYL81_03325 [Francisella tularensis]EKM88173.1 hypothetical protein B344_02310 [Francisella tularensis subsp. tularensis 831]EKM88329.1 hypothetical protein B345_02337 [Francisella tularensis subsp. tularensis AS_713]EKM91791.1 hypothetical pro